MIKVGVTGGIGSGKSVFCKEWEKLGAYVIYADDFAKDLMHSDEELKNKIKEKFGDESYKEDGSLNRQYLAEEAFEKGRVQDLNKLVHPLLWRRINSIAEGKEQEGVKIFAVEAAILLNNGKPKHVDYVILLQSAEETRTKRVIARDEVKENQVLARMNKQPDFDAISHLSHEIIRNDGTLEELKTKAQTSFKDLLIKISQ